MKTYEGKRTIDGLVVTADGRPLPEHYEVKRFTKYGFEWTYEGESPQQLSLAILYDYLGDKERAILLSEPFMKTVIANLDNDWKLTGEEIDAFVRAKAESAYHPCGTCKMGNDPMAVVDPQCRVIGIDRLRVADSSIFPQVTNGNLNAPSIMTGEKASDLILGRDPLPASNLEPWINPDWRASQR